MSDWSKEEEENTKQNQGDLTNPLVKQFLYRIVAEFGNVESIDYAQGQRIPGAHNWINGNLCL